MTREVFAFVLQRLRTLLYRFQDLQRERRRK
jgi:hypothetical protein